METPKVLTISDLLRRSRPLTGTASLHPHPSSLSPNLFIPSSSFDSSSRNRATSDRNPNLRLLAPLNHPAIIIGTLTLPPHSDSSSSSERSLRCSKSSCFSFYDGSASICCDVLDLNVHMIGRKIHVLAWNFIPFNGGGGFLEIIRWSFPDCSGGICQSSNLCSFPLALESDSSSSCKEGLKARYAVYGILESVSPVSVVPCTIGPHNSKGGSETNSGCIRNLGGFLVQMRVCECKFCRLKKSATCVADSLELLNSHSFILSAIVYFCGSASSWHPVLSKLVGNTLSLSGLKKKLIFIGKEQSCLMYVTSEKSFVHILKLPIRLLSFRKNDIVKTGECAVYTGIVKGIYMQGMVVELDREVWLLLTDQLLTPPHSLRVGALISVKNVHFVNPKFSWTKMLILGACFKTSINIESYSPMETRCHMVSHSQSLLGKFIASLAFSARFWVLFLVLCLRKKFTGILSEKEILGSKHLQGVTRGKD